MAVSPFTTLRYDLRTIIRDNFGTFMDDTCLDEIINEAQREYSLYANTIVSSVDFVTTNANIYSLPDDFIEIKEFVDKQGNYVPIVSYQWLNKHYGDFRKITGNHLQAVCLDFDLYHKIRFFPLLPADMNVGKIFYCRTPQKNIIETTNTEAIIKHCLFQISFFAGKSTTENFYQDFIDAVDSEARSNKTLANRQTTRKGVYF